MRSGTRVKTLPPAEMLAMNEVLGGYIFVCNSKTMQEDLRRQVLVIIFLSFNIFFSFF